MLNVKSIKKEGKNLTIIIKKPYFMSLQKFMKKNNLYLSKYDKEEEEYNFNWCLTVNGDIKLEFILRNSDDIRPYKESTDICKEIGHEIVKQLKKKPKVVVDGIEINPDTKYSKNQSRFSRKGELNEKEKK